MRGGAGWLRGFPVASLALASMGRQEFERRVRWLVRGGLLACWLWLAAGLMAGMSLGLADNGDFTRAMTVFTSRPVDIKPNWPDRKSQPELFDRRFHKYWVPDYRLDFPQPFTLQRPHKSSTYLLWAGGVWLNRMLYSPEVLNLAVMSIPARLVLLLLAAAVFLHLERHSRGWERPASLLLLALPLALLLVSPYSYLLNTFFFQGGQLVFALLFLAAVGLAAHRPLPLAVLVGLVFSTSLLLATSKAGQFFWPFLAWMVVWLVAQPPWPKSLAVGLTATTLAAFSLLFTWPSRQSAKDHAFHRLFNGFLMASTDPKEHLRRLGLAHLAPCLGATVWSAQGGWCLQEAQPVLGTGTTLRVLLREPGILPRALGRMASEMQEVRVVRAGTLSEKDPRTQLYGPRYFPPGSDLWMQLKARYAPRGWPLLVVLLLGAFVHTYAFRQEGELARTCGLVGLVAGLGCLGDMVVQFLGDGFAGAVRHLYLANLLSDVFLMTLAVTGAFATSQLLKNKSFLSWQS